MAQLPKLIRSDKSLRDDELGSDGSTGENIKQVIHRTHAS
jgi:hypothetical protein